MTANGFMPPEYDDSTEKAALLCAVLVVALPIVLCLITIGVKALLHSFLP